MRKSRDSKAFRLSVHPATPLHRGIKRCYDSVMTPRAIDQELTREPFVPIRLFVSDGHSYEIRNPGLCLIVRGTLYIARTDRPSRVSDDMDVIDCVHVTRIEQVGDKASPTTTLSPNT